LTNAARSGAGIGDGFVVAWGVADGPGGSVAAAVVLTGVGDGVAGEVAIGGVGGATGAAGASAQLTRVSRRSGSKKAARVDMFTVQYPVISVQCPVFSVERGLREQEDGGTGARHFRNASHLASARRSKGFY
jgi:hypothetical protein